jgi:hypothetical protein
MTNKTFASGKNAIAICDRSGLKFPYAEIVTEQGTGLRVHRSELDGVYNRVTNPLLKIKTVGDKIGLKNALTDDLEDSGDVLSYLVDEDGDLIVGTRLMFGVEEYIITK